MKGVVSNFKNFKYFYQKFIIKLLKFLIFLINSIYPNLRLNLS